MFISEDEFVLAGTDAGPVTAVKTQAGWVVQRPDGSRSQADIRYADIIAALEANAIPVEVKPVAGNIKNVGIPLVVARLRSEARAVKHQSKFRAARETASREKATKR